MPAGSSTPRSWPTRRRSPRPRFTIRALRWFRDRGVRVQRILTDNGSAYRSRVFGRVLRRLGIEHTRTRPYRPQTNGKVERWIRTVLSECPLPARIRQLGTASTCAGALHQVLQRGAPSPGHRWTDSERAAQATSWPPETVTNVSGDYI